MALLQVNGAEQGLDRSGFAQPCMLRRFGNPIGMGMTSSGLGMTSSGLGYFSSGLDFTQWGLAEWLTVGGLAFFAFGGMKLFRGKRSGGGSRRRALALARARYELERAKA